MVTAIERSIPGVASLATPEAPAVAEVGGKAASLIRLAQAGFDVPPGMVLAAGFFEPWLAQVRSSHEWQAVLTAARSCDAASPSVEQRRPIQKSCAIGFRVMKAPQQLASELIPSAWSPVEAPNEVWMSVVERL